MSWPLSVWAKSVVVWRVFFFKQKTAYEMRISDWSSDVCSSDLARTERKKDAEADKAAADAAAAAGAAPYAAPTAAANLTGTNLDNAITTEKLADAVTAAERGRVGDETRNKALDAYNAAPVLEQVADEIEKSSEEHRLHSSP